MPPESLSSALTGFGALLRAHETIVNLDPDDDDSGALILPNTPSDTPATSITVPPSYDYCISPQQHRQPPTHSRHQNNTSSDDDTHGSRQLSRNLWWKDDSSTIIHNPSPSPIPELERFLLNHYVHRVVHLFCVISYEKSPWKTIHLPRVLQSAGQLSLHGSTSTVRDALRNALLSISAFYLANDSRSRGCDSEAERWEEDAIMFRGRAIKLLKETVERSTPQSRPKYKELLATMLSMITINASHSLTHAFTRPFSH
jgi:arginine metabolism regulation protein II